MINDLIGQANNPIDIINLNLDPVAIKIVVKLITDDSSSVGPLSRD
jgi:hypothetical protein